MVPVHHLVEYLLKYFIIQDSFQQQAAEISTSCSSSFSIDDLSFSCSFSINDVSFSCHTASDSRERPDVSLDPSMFVTLFSKKVSDVFTKSASVLKNCQIFLFHFRELGWHSGYVDFGSDKIVDGTKQFC